MKTSLSWRKKNKSQPYSAAFPAEVVDLNLEFQRKLVSASDYSVNLIYGAVNVNEDLENYSDNDRAYFSLSKTQSYGQQ